MFWVVENILASHKLAQQIIAKCQLCCPLIKISEDGLWPEVIHPDFLPACLSPVWSAGALACPRAALPSAPLCRAGLAALLPWLAAGFSHSFPVMGSCSWVLLLPLGAWAQAGDMAANQPCSQHGELSRTVGEWSTITICFYRSILKDHACIGGFPGLNTGWKRGNLLGLVFSALQPAVLTRRANVAFSVLMFSAVDITPEVLHNHVWGSFTIS